MAFQADEAVGNIVGMIVGILVAAILVGALLPEAVSFINSANTSQWGDAELAMFNLLPLVFVLIPFCALIMWVVKAF